MMNYFFESRCNKFGVILSHSVYGKIIGECQRSGKIETGGILIGFYSEDMNNAIITVATNPTEDSKSYKTSFLRGTKKLLEVLDNYWELGEYYIGEWHFHPGFSPNPSNIDIMQMKQLSTNKKLKCSEPILLIVGQDSESNWLLSIHIVTKNETIKLIQINKKI